MVSPLHIQFLLLHFLIVSNNCGCSYVEIFYSRLLFHFLKSIYFPLLFLHLCSFLRLRWPDPFSCRSHSLSVTPLLAFSICCILLQILIWGREKYSINREILIWIYTGCPRRNVQYFGRVFLMLNYTDITQNTYIQSWTVTEIMAREVWNFDSCYTPIDYQIHIETGRNM